MSILWLLGFVLILLFAIAAVSFAPWVPTKNRDVERAIRLASIRHGEIFYDLGCGEGRVTFAAARAGASAIGVELFFPLYLVCLVRKWLYCHFDRSAAQWRNPFWFFKGPAYRSTLRAEGRSLDYTRDDKTVGQVTFKCKNLFKEDLSQADIIFVFGMPDALKNRLREKLDRELKSGARIISYCFAIDGWTPVTIDKGEKNDELSLFVYKK